MTVCVKGLARLAVFVCLPLLRCCRLWGAQGEGEGAVEIALSRQEAARKNFQEDCAFKTAGIPNSSGCASVRMCTRSSNALLMHQEHGPYLQHTLNRVMRGRSFKCRRRGRTFSDAATEST